MSTSARISPPQRRRPEAGSLLRWAMVAALLMVTMLVVLTGIRTAHLADIDPTAPVHPVAPIVRSVPSPSPVAPAPRVQAPSPRAITQASRTADD